MKEYKYNECISRFYDIVYERPAFTPALNFYLNEISQTNGASLEIGVGTGRIFARALDSGADIYGIDQSDLMLEKLKAKISPEEYARVTIQDVREFKLDKKFELIIAPFRMFSHLVKVEDQLKALKRIYEHLETGGRFIFDVFVPDLNRLLKDVDNVKEFEGEYEPGKKLERYASIKYDNINQMSNLTFKFVWDENGGTKTDECYFPFRYYHRFEIENLIARAGFRLEKIYGGFEKKDLDERSTDFVVVCIK
ncbi:MAG: class I SAM-dependent methyltransferase [bacterium]|nr:class I SAM-dependent methyltransferase [bacterium]